MLFFGKKPADASANSDATHGPGKRSMLGLLFNPEIGASIRPLGDTGRIFVQLIAMVFAMNGLFPKDHPALSGANDTETNTRLTLSEVISTAWRQLSFTPAGLPKVLLFFAVAGTIIFAILSLVTALLAGFMGTAHAAGTDPSQASGYFAPAGSNDLAQNWIDYIFKALPLSNYYSQTGLAIPQTINIQCAMMTALGFYSNAILIFAAIILFYHLASMVVETAHTGVVMGKRANQIWAPIRLVVAVGLLVPVGGNAPACHLSGGGLNAGQYIVIQMAEWGSGLASQVWGKFITTLAGMQYNYIQPSTPYVNGVVADIASMEACKFAWNYQICAADAATNGQNPAQACANPNTYTPASTSPGYGHNIPTPTPTTTDSITGDVTYSYASPLMNAADVCGSFTVPGKIQQTQTDQASSTVGATLAQTVNPDQIAQSLSQAHQTTVNGLLSAFAALGADIHYFMPVLYSGSPPPNQDFGNLVNNYQNSLAQNLRSILNSNGAITSSQLDASNITPLGWAAAGAWLNTVARDQGSIVNAYEDGLPKTLPPDQSKLASDPDIGQHVAVALDDYKTWIEHGYAMASPTTTVSLTGNAGCATQAAAATGGSTPETSILPTNLPSVDPQYLDTMVGTLDPNGEMRGLIDQLGGNAGGKTIIDKIFSVVDAQAVRSGIWGYNNSVCSGSQYFSLGTQLVTANPLAEISFWGYANLRAAYSLWQGILEYSMAQIGKKIEFQVRAFTRNIVQNQIQLQRLGMQSEYFGFVASIFGMISTVFFTCGYTLAFVVPLLPFFRFFFNVLTWIVSLLEAVVAMPLVALAHLNPEGEGLPGPSAKAAYFFIFNIFLRPTMTVFGLVAGLIVFYVAIMLLNATFAIAVAGTTGSYHFGVGTVIRIIYTLTYAATAYVCANNAFKPIGMFPEYALRWVGQQGHHEKMGDAGRAVQGVMGQAGGYLEEKPIGLVKLKPPV